MVEGRPQACQHRGQAVTILPPPHLVIPLLRARGQLQPLLQACSLCPCSAVLQPGTLYEECRPRSAGSALRHPALPPPVEGLYFWGRICTMIVLGLDIEKLKVPGDPGNPDGSGLCREGRPVRKGAGLKRETVAQVIGPGEISGSLHKLEEDP